MRAERRSDAASQIWHLSAAGTRTRGRIAAARGSLHGADGLARDPAKAQSRPRACPEVFLRHGCTASQSSRRRAERCVAVVGVSSESLRWRDEIEEWSKVRVWPWQSAIRAPGMSIRELRMWACLSPPQLLCRCSQVFGREFARPVWDHVCVCHAQGGAESASERAGYGRKLEEVEHLECVFELEHAHRGPHHVGPVCWSVLCE
jgi:hypothetical protein